MRATQRVYRTTDNRLVPEGDEEAAFLVCAPGQDIPDGYDDVPDWATTETDHVEDGAPSDPVSALEEATRPGDEKEATVEAKPETKQVGKPEDKSVPAPDENKGTTPAKTPAKKAPANKAPAAKKR